MCLPMAVTGIANTAPMTPKLFAPISRARKLVKKLSPTCCPTRLGISTLYSRPWTTAKTLSKDR